uniref:Uncharacterized protein n=1 Tax=Globodera rostochiensis TaxID=31243 RepID=A0A914GY59_GLORO
MGKKLSSTGMNTNPCTKPMTIVSLNGQTSTGDSPTKFGMSRDLFGPEKSEEWTAAGAAMSENEIGAESRRLSQLYVGVRPIDKCLRIAYAKAMDIKQQGILQVMMENDKDFRVYNEPASGQDGGDAAPEGRRWTNGEVPEGEIIKF